MSESTATQTNELADIREAIEEIRNEGLKAALVHGVVESTLVLIALAVGLSLAHTPSIPETVATPSSVVGALNDAAASAGYTGTPFPEPYTVSGALVVAVGVALVFFVIDVALVYRSRTVEAYESFNPEVREALRTARDAAEDGRDDTMTRQLYADVLARLDATSSEEFISGRRMAMSLFLIVGIGLLMMYASVLGFNFQPGDGLFPGGGGGGGSQATADSQDTSTEKRAAWDDASGVLGEEKPPAAGGSDTVGVSLTQSGSASADGGGGSEPGEFPDTTGEVETERSGYDQQEQIEDAELVKGYSLRVSEDE